MSLRIKKSAGGPKTAKGKQASSQNALVHGAASNKVTSAVQQSLVEQYVYDLTAYYKPESPLEKMQIQRIALCKAKLDALYELEQVKLQIACEDLECAPELVMQKIGSGDDLAQAFAEKISQGRDLELPMGLTPQLLKDFSAEIIALGGKLEIGDDLNLALPCLGRFIHDAANQIGVTPYQVLLRIGKNTNDLLEKKGAIEYKFMELLRTIKQARQEEVYGKSSAHTDIPDQEGEPDLDKIQESLNGIIRLNLVVNNAFELAQKFLRMQDLMLRSVTLSGEESDRLLRYQTTWERRLSSAIGELLALQAKNGKQ